MSGRDNGRYPYKYLEMIDNVFGKENTIEVCSHNVVSSSKENCFTVDINPDTNPDLVCDGQTLNGISNGTFDRWSILTRKPANMLGQASVFYRLDAMNADMIVA